MPTVIVQARFSLVNTTPSYLFEEIKVYTVALFLAHKEISLFETSRDGSDIHGRDFRSGLLFSCHGRLESGWYGVNLAHYQRSWKIVGRKCLPRRTFTTFFGGMYVGLAGGLLLSYLANIGYLILQR
jgi:small ligand-binding sensory domain FIST